jgi:glycosyltransferase involved in cell wall biosynthesis
MPTDSRSQRRPRVLVVTHLFPTASKPIQGPWVAEQVDALATYADVTVLCASQWAENGSEVRDSGVRVHFAHTATPLGHGRAGLLASSVRYELALNRFLSTHAEEFDIVHAHFGFPDAVAVSRVARRFSLPYVITLHGDDAFRLLPRQDSLGRLIRDAVAGSAMTLCVSDAMFSAVSAVMPDARVSVLKNGYDSTLFTLSEKPRDGGLLFVGLLVPVKNIDVLLRAYAAKRVEIGLPLTIAGDGPLRSELEQLAAELGVSDSVRFLGQQSRSQVAELMASAKALLLPSASEGWGLVAAESLACGTPVVASRVGGVPEIVGSDDAGILVPPGDAKALTDALIAVAKESWNPATVAAASNARPWAEQTALLADVYRDAIAR